PLRHTSRASGVASRDHSQEDGRHQHRRAVRNAIAWLRDRPAHWRHDRGPFRPNQRVLLSRLYHRGREPVHLSHARAVQIHHVRPIQQSLRRWLKSTSHRTFIVYPVVIIAAEWLLHGGRLPFVPWFAPLLAWGYLQYRLVGGYRRAAGGGGPGMS